MKRLSLVQLLVKYVERSLLGQLESFEAVPLIHQLLGMVLHKYLRTTLYFAIWLSCSGIWIVYGTGIIGNKYGSERVKVSNYYRANVM